MSPENPTFDRRPDLDALRAAAMLLGIALHGALSFFPSFWVVSDRSQDPGFGVFVSAVHGFRMPVFFVMSGYFGAMLLHRRGRRAMLRHRFSRVLLPLLLGMVTVVPATIAVSILANASASRRPDPASKAGEASDIWSAAGAGDLGAIERCLAEGASVDGLDGERGWSPILHASLADRAEAVELLARRGADVNVAASDGGTPLHAAAFLGHEKTVAALLRSGSDINATNHRGATPLDNADIDEGTTLFFASRLQLKVDEDGLGGRKAAVAAYLREHGATGGRKAGLAELLMQFPVFHHLWFLWFLWWLTLGLAAASALASRWPSIGLPGRAVVSPLRYLWLIPLTMIPQAYMGEGLGFGPDTSTGLLPIPHVLAYYAIFFGFGAIYYGQEDRDGRVGEHGWLPLAIGLLVAFPAGMALSGAWPGLPGAGLDPRWRRWLAVFLQAAYPWLMTFGLMGLFRRAFKVESPTMRYLSDSAYWLYLAHLPLIIAMQYLVKDWPLPSFAKFSLIVATVPLLLLWAYQTMVRYTWLGRLLNGPRTRPARVGATTAA